MAGAGRQMSLVGFMQAGNTSVYAGSWRHPATEHGFLTRQLLPEARAHPRGGLLRPDVLRRPAGHARGLRRVGRRGGAHRRPAGEARPQRGARRDRRPPPAHIGLGATYSTTYYSPFHVARTFATLDHLSGGRAAWNVVTSVNDSEAQNFGLDEAPRPRRALRPGRRVPRGDHRPVGHLGGRRPRPRPRGNGVFADPDKVHELNYEGDWYKVRGPLTVPRSAAGPAGAAAGGLVGAGPGRSRLAGPS